MQRLVLTGIALAMAASTASAGERSLFRSPFGYRPLFVAQAPEPAPVPQNLQPTPMVVPGAPMVTPVPQGYAVPHGHVVHAPRVKIKDPDHIHPCAVPTTIMVLDPCACHDPCNCCAPACVPVTICVPPCACMEHKVRREGRYQKFDYGKYEVEVRVKDGYVEVDYDD